MKSKRPSRQVRRTARQHVRRQLPARKRFMAHPATLFLLLCVGVFITNWTFKSLADTVVTATIHAQPLTDGAIITQPADGTVFTSIPINVSGTCPSDSYVNLVRNGAFSGTAWCDTGQFTIQTDLSEGTNSLQAQDYNITNDPGPVTSAINVTYSPPKPQTLPPNEVNKLQKQAGIPANTTPVPTNLPLLLSSAFSYKSFAIGETFQWTVGLSGGVSPYVVQVDWGDGNSSTQAVYATGDFNISHVYQTAGYFPVKVHAVDDKGNQAYLQLAALVRQTGATGFTQSQSQPPTPAASKPGFFGRLKPKLWLAWSSFGVVSVMSFSYWLGARQEAQVLLQHHFGHRH